MTLIVDSEKQEHLEISVEDIEKVLRKMPNWEVPGSDLVQGFWLNNLTICIIY